MKSVHLYLLITIAISNFNCSGSKKTTNDNKSVSTGNTEITGTAQGGDAKKTFRFTVSFISKGAGTDYQIKQKYDGFITDFETKNKVKIAVNKASWGREGETDYCFELKEISKELATQFIAESKALLSASDRINLGENTHCRGEIK